MVTNYERIKSMTIEELTEFLLSGTGECPIFLLRKLKPCPKCGCKECVKQWLQEGDREEQNAR